MAFDGDFFGEGLKVVSVRPTYNPFITHSEPLMSLSMYQASVPSFVQAFENLTKILEKAEAYATAKKFDSTVLVTARLAPDMLPLAKQVQIATDIAKGCAARLAGEEVPSYEDNETTIPELRARLAKTIAFLKSLDAKTIDGSEDKQITLKMQGKDVTFVGQPYLVHFVVPNVFFHVTTAYAILRHNGVEIGKMDYIGELKTA